MRRPDPNLPGEMVEFESLTPERFTLCETLARTDQHGKAKIKAKSSPEPSTDKDDAQVSARLVEVPLVFDLEDFTVMDVAILLVDTDRNGVVDDNDEEGKDAFTKERGAVILVNTDDSNADDMMDCENDEIDTPIDTAQLAEVVIQRSNMEGRWGQTWKTENASRCSLAVFCIPRLTRMAPRRPAWKRSPRRCSTPPHPTRCCRWFSR